MRDQGGMEEGQEEANRRIRCSVGGWGEGRGRGRAAR